MNNDRKNVVALAACQALLVMNNATMISIGTLAADALAANKMLVTVPATAYIIGGGLTTMPISLFMKRHGRRAGFLVGCLFGMIGGALATTAMLAHNFWMLCLAALVSGIYTGAGGFYRFAAADSGSVNARSKAISLVLAGGITAYGVMNLLMAATPLAMKMCSHPYGAAMLVIEWHIIAMFAPAFGTGWLIARVGTLPVMFAGLLLNLAAITIAISSTTVIAFWTSMVLVGVGWCFLFVGGTTLLTEAYAPAEKAKTQGMNDLLIYLTMGSTSLTSGAILYGFGWNTLNLTALPLLALTAIAILWLATIRRIGRAVIAPDTP